jgi:hypothetical protein
MDPADRLKEILEEIEAIRANSAETPELRDAASARLAALGEEAERLSSEALASALHELKEAIAEVRDHRGGSSST